MPFIEQSSRDVWGQRARRVLINGPPNSGKTTSLRTWPKPMIVLSYPGEKGSTSIPHEDGVRAFVWDLPDPEKVQNWVGVLAEVNRLTFDILHGKHGPISTFAGDGLHKFFDVCLNVATAGARGRAENFEASKYGPAGVLFFGYIERVLASSAVANVVMTCWDGREKDDPDERGANPSRHIFPELPGQAAKAVMGEFAVVMYAIREGAGPAARYLWQTQPMGKVWGAGVKMPLEIAKSLPLTIPQEWPMLERYLIPKEGKDA